MQVDAQYIITNKGTRGGDKYNMAIQAKYVLY